MVGANIKAETLALMDQRAVMETEMNLIIARLCRPGGPGISSNLVDSEGFPRADIDVGAARADRKKLAELKNDHKHITETIEKNIHILHSGGFSILPQKRTASNSTASGDQVLAQRPVVPSASSSLEVPMDEDKHNGIPFAVFDEVTEGSPAALDGIQVGDQLLKFGEVERGEDALRRLAREGQRNEGRAVAVVVRRRGFEVHLNLTPRRWAGNGILGCHLQPL